MNKNLQILGIARKAGLVAIGGEAVAAASRAGSAKLVLSASDTSSGTLRRARIGAREGGAVFSTIPYTKFELGQIIGRGPTGTIAILDAGLSAKFMGGLAETNPGRYDDTLELLERNTSRRTAK